MKDVPSPEAEKQLEELREKLAPTLARIAIRIHKDGLRLKALEEERRRTQESSASEKS